MPEPTFEELIDELHSFSCNAGDLSTEKISDEFKEKFLNIACHLMNKYCINASGTLYKIIECEIYYNDGRNHIDPYIYGRVGGTIYQQYAAEKQKKKLHWFFHYSGVDLTIGNENDIIGGILIRKVKEIHSDNNNNNRYDGPSKLANSILNNIQGSAFAGGKHIFLVECVDMENRRLNTPVPRIGLGAKDISYRDKEYNYRLM